MQQVEITTAPNTGPDTFRSSMLRALQLENEDQLDMACATYEQAIAAGGSQQLGLHAGLFRCQLPDPSRLQALIARTDALLSKHSREPTWTRKLNEYRAEAVIRLADWDKLDQVVAMVRSTYLSLNLFPLYAVLLFCTFFLFQRNLLSRHGLQVSARSSFL